MKWNEVEILYEWWVNKAAAKTRAHSTNQNGWINVRDIYWDLSFTFRYSRVSVLKVYLHGKKNVSLIRYFCTTEKLLKLSKLSIILLLAMICTSLLPIKNPYFRLQLEQVRSPFRFPPILPLALFKCTNGSFSVEILCWWLTIIFACISIKFSFHLGGLLESVGQHKVSWNNT